MEEPTETSRFKMKEGFTSALKARTQAFMAKYVNLASFFFTNNDRNETKSQFKFHRNIQYEEMDIKNEKGEELG